MSGAWTRFKQSTRETFKNTKDDLTEIPNDVNTLLLKADGVSQLYSEIINKAQLFCPESKLKAKNVDDPTKAQPLHALGETLQMLAAEHQQSAEISRFLNEASKTMSMLAREKNELDASCLECFITPKREIINQNIGEAIQHQEKLKVKRLELDAAKHRLKQEKKTAEDPGKIKKYELEVQSAQLRFDAEVQSIRQLLTPVTTESEMSSMQCTQSASLLLAMKDYFYKSYMALEELDKRHQLDQMKHNPPLGPDTGRQTAPFLRPLSTSLTTSSADHTTPQRPLAGRNGLSPHTHSLSRSSSQPSPLQQTAPPLMVKPSAVRGGVPVMAMHTPPTLRTELERRSTAFSPRTQRCRALYDFAAQQSGDLSMQSGDVIEITDRSKGDWWEGINTRTGQQGHFPGNYVQTL